MALLSLGDLRAHASLTDSLSQSASLSRQARDVVASDPLKAFALAQLAGRLADQSRAPPRERALAVATSQWLQGEAALRLNNPTTATGLLTDAFTVVSKQSPGSGLQADILVSRARLESTTDQAQRALADYLAAFEIYKSARNKHQQAVTLEDIGLLYHNAGDYDRSLGYYAQSRATFSGAPVLDLSIDNNRADSLVELGRYREAEGDYMSALRIAGRLASPSLEAQILGNLAFAQISNREYGAAESTVENGLRLARGAAKAVLPTLLSTSAQLDLRKNNLSAARAAVDAISDRPDGEAASERDEWVHRTKYEVYKAQGDNDKALKELESYQKIQNGHRMLMASTNTALLAARFDFDNQNARISALKTGQLRRDIALTRLRARQGQIVLGGLLAIVTALIVFLVLYLRTLRLNHRRTREINAQLSETNAKLENALQAKTQFLATTSHEIRTPLNGVLGLTEVLLAGQGLSSWVRQRVSLIHGAGEAMRVLVDDLLDMSKMDAAQIVLQREMVDLPTLLWEIYRFWLSHAEGAGLTLTLDMAEAPVMIVEDARRLRQILSNLLSNAVKFTPAGSIILSARSAPNETGEDLVIVVSDTGIGIPQEAREMIFEKFNQLDASITRKYGGTGLGLSIARSLAQTMGGNIAAKANPSGGSDFVLTLPLERVPTAESSQPEPSLAGTALHELRVVVVEANPITQGSLRSLLERRVDTLVFRSATKEAIETLGVCGAHVVIASFPKGGRIAHGADDKDMAELARVCQRAGVYLVIILDAHDVDARFSLQFPGASYLERPVTAAKLAEHLESLDDLQTPPLALQA